MATKAGLLQPDLFCEIPVGGGLDSPLYASAVSRFECLSDPMCSFKICFDDFA